MCGKKLTFLHTSPYHHVEYNVEGRKVAFIKSVKKNNIHDYICDQSLNGFG